MYVISAVKARPLVRVGCSPEWLCPILRYKTSTAGVSMYNSGCCGGCWKLVYAGRQLAHRMMITLGDNHVTNMDPHLVAIKRKWI